MRCFIQKFCKRGHNSLFKILGGHHVVWACEFQIPRAAQNSRGGKCPPIPLNETVVCVRCLFLSIQALAREREGERRRERGVEREREGLSALGGGGGVLRDCLERNAECWRKDEGRERRGGGESELFGGEAVEEGEGEEIVGVGKLIKKHES